MELVNISEQELKEWKEAKEWRGMFSAVIAELNAAAVGEWKEITNFESEGSLRVKQINLITLVKDKQLLGAGYRVQTRKKIGVSGKWSLCVCKIKVSKKGKRK